MHIMMLRADSRRCFSTDIRQGKPQIEMNRAEGLILYCATHHQTKRSILMRQKRVTNQNRVRC